MKYIFTFLPLFAASPLIARAAIDRPESIQEFGLYLIVFLNITIMPFLFSLALLFFIYNVVRLFIIAPGNDTKREDAKRYAVYSIIAFVLMASVWGIVNLVVNGTGLGQSEGICPDTVPDCDIFWKAGSIPDGMKYPGEPVTLPPTS